MTDQTACNCPDVGGTKMHSVGCILRTMGGPLNNQVADIIDQPPPIPNDRVAIVDLVIEDMVERKRVGTERYGTPLQAHNGRDMLVDAYQEALDQCIYLRGEIADRAEVPWFSAWDLGQLTSIHIPPDELEPMAARIRAHFGQPLQRPT